MGRELIAVCGIAGWVDFGRDLRTEAATVTQMGGVLAHRGPDAVGLWLSPHAGLAHRRLVVVDPAGGGQPMVRRRGRRRWVIVYNGELYNTAELRRELQSRGHVFKSYSDTEALLRSYMEWGPACLPHLNGIFAFAVWSDTDETLFAARDRLGVKPFFYAERDGAFLFGSEIKAVLAHPAVPAEVDATGLAEVLILGPARTPGCAVFRGVGELKPGQYLLHDRTGTKVERYWALRSAPHPDDLDTTVARVRNILCDAVKRQLVSDVPVCALLSGGLDSSAISAFAAEALMAEGRGPLDTYSVDYAGSDRDFRANEYQPDLDAPWTERVSAHLGTRHHRVTLGTEELVEALEVSLRANDLPGMVDIDSSLYLFCREIRRRATVALSGEAADEVFGGYPWFRSSRAPEVDTFPWAGAIRQRASLLSPQALRAIQPEEYARARYYEALAEVPGEPGQNPERARERAIFHLNITRFMPTLLDRKDRMSMAVGLEVRVPYCDHRLVEYVWNVPWEIKFCDQREKGLLRRALRGILPDDVVKLDFDS